MRLLPEPAGMPLLYCSGRQQIAGADLGSADAGETLPSSRDYDPEHPEGSHWLGVMGEGGNEDQPLHSGRVAMGKGLAMAPPME